MKWYYIFLPVAVFLTAWAGSALTTASLQDWYLQINKPAWTPPGLYIGLVWTVLFVLLAIAGILVWKKMPRPAPSGAGARGRGFTMFAVIFFVNLGLNALWSYLFFSAHLLPAAFFEALVLGLSVLLLIILSWKSVRAAAWMLVPYCVWVFFAAYLTYVVWMMN